MAKVIVYFAHPGQRHSRVNVAMATAAKALKDIAFVDLYADYPRGNVKVEREQERLVAHDVILFQMPLFWYSTPSLVKEWQDLVLQHGFAYGHGGEKLAGKVFMLAVTAGGSAEAYTEKGYQHYPLRTFLTPLEQTARLCGMTFPAPYVLYEALRASDDGDISAHVTGYSRLLRALRDDTYDLTAAASRDVISHADLPILQGV